MGDFFGKKSKAKQTAAMNEMNAMIQRQVEEFKGQQQSAQQQLDRTRTDYEDFQFTNPFASAQNVFADAQNPYADLQNRYEGMENRFEDMTVDMRAADFQAQQGRQQRANIMQGLRGSAGTSGVAGLAQALANQGAMQAQQISADISRQERQNQMMAAQEGARIDQLQRGAGMQLDQLAAQGAMQTQQMQMSGAAQQQQMILEGGAMQQAAEAQQQSTLLGMDYGLLAGANQAYQGALANQMAGMGMKADMYGAQSRNNMFSTLVDAGSNMFSFDIPLGKGDN